MAKDKAASLNPDDFAEGGGLVDDVDAVFTGVLFDMFDYNGTVQPGVPAIALVLDIDDMDEITQYYSMGNANDWMPSDDGSQLMAVGQATSIKMNSNGGIFLKSLIDAGFPAEDLGDDISVLDGLQAHLIRVPAPARPGIKKKERADGKKFDETILIVSEIIAMPGEKKSPKGKPKAAAGAGAKKKAATKKAPAKKEAADEGGDEDLNDKATNVILEILADENTIARNKLPAKLFKILKADPDRNAVVKLIASDDEFMGSGPWSFEDGVLSME